MLYYGVAAYLTNDSFNRGAMIMTSLIGAFNLAVNFYGRNQHDATWVKRKVAAVFVHSSQFAFVLALFGASGHRVRSRGRSCSVTRLPCLSPSLHERVFCWSGTPMCIRM